MFQWLCPLYAAYDAADERTSAQLAAVEMLRSGTTTFLEAGTIRFLDDVIDGLDEVGIRGRVGRGCGTSRPSRPSTGRRPTRRSAVSQRQLDDHPRGPDDAGLGVEHGRRPHDVQRSAVAGRQRARRRARRRDELPHVAGEARPRRVHRRVRPAADGPPRRDRRARPQRRHDPLRARRRPRARRDGAPRASTSPTARRPRSRSATASPRSASSRRWCSAASTSRSAPTATTPATTHDLMRATYLVAGLFKDARTDPQMFPAEKAYEMATLGGARTMQLDDQIGSLEPGKRADLVLHDTDRPEWRPLLNVVNQLVWSADGRGVHTVLVDGRVVVEDCRCTTDRRGPSCGPTPSSAARRSPPAAACPTRPSGPSGSTRPSAGRWSTCRRGRRCPAG